MRSDSGEEIEEVEDNLGARIRVNAQGNKGRKSISSHIGI